MYCDWVVFKFKILSIFNPKYFRLNSDFIFTYAKPAILQLHEISYYDNAYVDILIKMSRCLFLTSCSMKQFNDKIKKIVTICFYINCNM